MGVVIKSVTIQRQIFDRIAVCSARVSANNYFSVSKKDVESSTLEPGDQLRIRITRTDLDRKIKPMDSYTYSNTLQKSNQVYLPSDARDKLDLETGDIIKYAIIPKKSFPGFNEGPLRDRVKDLFAGSEDEPEQDETQRPEGETTSATFENSTMQKTGQVTVPSEIMKKVGLLQGDTVLATIKWQGEDISVNKDIGTGNRITISKDEREQLGLEPGDEPTVRIAYFG